MANSKQDATATARFLASPLSAAVAEILTLPLDLAKTRLQVERRLAKSDSKPRNLLSVLTDTYRSEGPRSLWKGLAPALLRQTCYTTLSMVLYEPIKQTLAVHWSYAFPQRHNMEASFPVRLLSGGTAGASAIFVFNWAEVIKVQIQASAKSLTVLEVARSVYKSRGILGFWSGVGPNVARTFIVNAAELGSYDQIKTEVFVPLVGNTFLAHLGASGSAGVISALVSTPVDVVKTRWMNEASLATGGRRVNMITRGALIFKEEGLGALYAGFAPICIRKVAWCAFFFCSYEYLLPIASFSLFKDASDLH